MPCVVWIFCVSFPDSVHFLALYVQEGRVQVLKIFIFVSMGKLLKGSKNINIQDK